MYYSDFVKSGIAFVERDESYFNDYGAVSMEIDPSTQKVYHTTYDD